MSDDLKAGQDAPQSDDQPKTAQDGGADQPPVDAWDGDIAKLPSKAQEYIRQLREEAASNRVKAKEEEAARIKREQEALAEQGKWKELAESRAAELEKLTGYQQRAESLEDILRKSNTARLERIPEDMRSLVPVDYLSPDQLNTWLDANESRLVKPSAPEIDAGAGTGGGGGTIRLTDEQRALAKKMNIDPETLLNQLKRDNQ